MIFKILILTSLCLQVKSQSPDELTIFNSLMDSIYDINYCQKIIYPPYYKCCSIDTLYGEQQEKCCEKSTVPKEYRVHCYRCINKEDLDSLNVIMIADDTLSAFYLRESREYLLSQIPKQSRFYNLIKNIKDPPGSRYFSLDSLHQGHIKFITQQEFNNQKYSHHFGRSGGQIFLGYFTLSRIYFDKIRGLGIFFMDWGGGNSCGYQRCILIYRDKETWKIEEKIPMGYY